MNDSFDTAAAKRTLTAHGWTLADDGTYRSPHPLRIDPADVPELETAQVVELVIDPATTPPEVIRKVSSLITRDTDDRQRLRGHA